MNEFISSINNSMGAVVKDKTGSKSIRCMMRIHNKGSEDAEDYTVLELKESKNTEDDDDQILTHQSKNSNEIFNLAFANNYLVLISTSKTNTTEQINNNDFKSGFSMVGFMNNEGKAGALETPKAFVMTESDKLKRFLKKDWISCYVRPIEKITTYLR